MKIDLTLLRSELEKAEKMLTAAQSIATESAGPLGHHAHIAHETLWRVLAYRADLVNQVHIAEHSQQRG